MNKFLFVCLIFCFSSLWSQDTLKEKSLDEVIIYSGKFAEHKKYIAQNIDVINATHIKNTNAQNTGDLLINTGNVFVQKSQQGGSSPVLRGFEASRILLVVDGIRMNNAIYRAGHLQNIITVDQNMLERIEVMYGPGSTLYGSDGLGGVLLMRTKMPQLADTNATALSGATFLRYSSANNEKTAHAEMNMGKKKWGWLQSVTYSSFGNVKMGSNYPDHYPGFGKRTFYIESINGKDSIVKNADSRVQKFSGYQQWDILQKLLFQPNEKVQQVLNVQLSNSTNVPRYDRLQDTRNGALRFAKWFYGPQKRQLAAYELSLKKPAFLTELKSIVSYQHLEESRHTREYKRYDRFDHRKENLHVGGITIDTRKLWHKHELTTGIDGQLNFVQSRAERENMLTGTTTQLDSRYPNGKNRMHYLGVYAQHLVKLLEGKLIVNDGLRWQYVTLHSQIADNSFFNFPFTAIQQKNNAITGNIGLVYLPSERNTLKANFASGFRAPNIDDLSRIFESSAAAKQLIVPNPEIKPEYTYTFDLSIQQKIIDFARMELTGYYTFFKNAIVLAPAQLNKQDSVLYNGSVSRIYANQNKNKAFLYGAHANIFLYPVKNIELFTTLTYTYGRIKNRDGSQTPLDHIPPIFGKTSLLYTYNNVSAEAYLLYNGWKRIAEYNLTGEDNAQYATPDGMPAWITWNVKASYRFGILLLQAGIENIADRNYRYFASGFSAPGRNFIIAVRTSF